MPSSPRSSGAIGFAPALTTFDAPIHRPPIASLDLRKFLETLRGESDRACAVLAGSFLDASLEDCFRANFIVDMPEWLFGPGGPLGTFAARIELAFALGWVSLAERCDLLLIRDISEEFAHDPDFSSTFEAPEIADRCFALQQSREFFEGEDAGVDDRPLFPWLLESRADPRLRFEITVSFIRQAIAYRASRSSHATVSTRAGG